MKNASFIWYQDNIDTEHEVYHHHAPALSIALIFIIILMTAAISKYFDLALAELASIYFFVTILFACGFRLKKISKTAKNARFKVMIRAFADLLVVNGLFYFIAATAALSCSALARTALPYADDALAAADRLLGFDWPAMMTWFQDNPVQAKFLIFTYSTLNWTVRKTLAFAGLFWFTASCWRRRR